MSTTPRMQSAMLRDGLKIYEVLQCGVERMFCFAESSLTEEKSQSSTSRLKGVAKRGMAQPRRKK